MGETHGTHVGLSCTLCWFLLWFYVELNRLKVHTYTSLQLHCRTATGTRMLFGITQCYLPTKLTFQPSPQPRLVLDFVTLEECKAELA